MMLDGCRGMSGALEQSRVNSRGVEGCRGAWEKTTEKAIKPKIRLARGRGRRSEDNSWAMVAVGWSLWFGGMTEPPAG